MKFLEGWAVGRGSCTNRFDFGGDPYSAVDPESFSRIFTRATLCYRGLCDSNVTNVYVCLSVCLSVTRRYCA